MSRQLSEESRKYLLGTRQKSSKIQVKIEKVSDGVTKKTRRTQEVPMILTGSHLEGPAITQDQINSVLSKNQPFVERQGAHVEAGIIKAPEVPELDRVKGDVKRYLRCANTVRGERPCCMGNQCASQAVTKKDKQLIVKQPRHTVNWILREWFPPNMGDVAVKNGPPRRCILCLANSSTTLVTSNITLNKSSPAEMMQSFRVRVDEPGQYPKEAMLPVRYNNMHTGILYPIFAFNVNNYTWVEETDEYGDENMFLREGEALEYCESTDSPGFYQRPTDR